jgi:hypothetical protein
VRGEYAFIDAEYAAQADDAPIIGADLPVAWCVPWLTLTLPAA